MNKLFIKVIALIILISSCGKEEKVHPTPDLVLQKTSFEQLVGWNNDDISEAKDAFLLSCQRLQNKQSQYISNAEIKILTKDYKRICLLAKTDKPENFKTFVEQNFTPYLISFKGTTKQEHCLYHL